MAHSHREHLGKHAAGHSGSAAAEVDTRQCLVDHARAGLGQPEATQARVDDPRQSVLVPGQGLQGHRAVTVTPPLLCVRSTSLFAPAPHPVLPQLLNGHARLGSTKAQRAPLCQSLLQRHLGLTAPRSARLHQTTALVEITDPHRGQPLLRGTTGDRTDPARSDLAHSRATTQQRDLPVLDEDPRLVGGRSGDYAAKQAGWPITEAR